MDDQTNTATIAVRIDASGLTCPMPVVRAKKGIAGIEVGQLMEIIATDAGAMADFAAWTRATGNELLSGEQHGEFFRFIIRRLK